MKITNSLIQKRKATSWLLLVLFLVCFNINFSTAGETRQDEILISGIVTDANSNEPLPGVNVMVKGTSYGTVTDIDGKYSIQVSLNLKCLI